MSDPRRAFHPPSRGLPDAAALPSRPHVVVIGGGIAGLAAATGLAERGVTVDIVERETYLGGRVGGWPDTLSDGTAVTMNRGFHAFFRQYYNLRTLLRRIDSQLSMLVPVDDYPLVDAHGRRDTFRGLPQTPPLNALAFALRSPTFRLRDLARLNASCRGPAGRGVGARHLSTDSITSTPTPSCATSTSPRRRDIWRSRCSPAASSPSRPTLSAAELATMFHIYFLGSSEGLIFDVANANFDVALWNPLRSYLEARGVHFHTGVAVTKVGNADTRFRCTCDSGRTFDADGVVLATDVSGLQRIVANSPAWATTAGATGSPTWAPRRRSSCSGCGWTGR